MSEINDQKIKLFGKTIGLPPPAPAPDTDSGGYGSEKSFESNCSSGSVIEGSSVNRDAEEKGSIKELSCAKNVDEKEDNPLQPLTSDELKSSNSTEQISADTNSHDHKILKKPDKILPCPRCNSMDTKFCYYNNYNVSQPRHFCKNCQRYWTAGGTMRSVPVGAGRRKNKNPASQFTHMNLPRSGPHVCEEKEISAPNENKENGSNGSNFHVFQTPTNWPFPWNSPNSFPVPFYSAAPTHWGYGVPNVMNVPCFFPSMPIAPGPTLPTLGKHSRDGNEIESENRVWIPKSSRIDDLGEDAKISIWANLGIKNETGDSMGGFKAFERQSKGDGKARVVETSNALQANPAALSRSLRFRENS